MVMGGSQCLQTGVRSPLAIVTNPRARDHNFFNLDGAVRGVPHLYDGFNTRSLFPTVWVHLPYHDHNIARWTEVLKSLLKARSDVKFPSWVASSAAALPGSCVAIHPTKYNRLPCLVQV
jgi:hypothetical protein